MPLLQLALRTQVKYVVELARALGQQPGILRVDLLTRLITDPAVSPDYGVPVEPLLSSDGSSGDPGAPGAFIVRLACGSPSVYLRKELLWPHLREFADRALGHVRCAPALQPCSRCARAAFSPDARAAPPQRDAGGAGGEVGGRGAAAVRARALRGRGGGARAGGVHAGLRVRGDGAQPGPHQAGEPAARRPHDARRGGGALQAQPPHRGGGARARRGGPGHLQARGAARTRGHRRPAAPRVRR